MSPSMFALTKWTSYIECLDTTEDLDVEDDTSQSEDHLGKKQWLPLIAYTFLTHWFKLFFSGGERIQNPHLSFVF